MKPFIGLFALVLILNGCIKSVIGASYFDWRAVIPIVGLTFGVVTLVNNFPFQPSAKEAMAKLLPDALNGNPVTAEVEPVPKTLIVKSKDKCTTRPTLV